MCVCVCILNNTNIYASVYTHVILTTYSAAVETLQHYCTSSITMFVHFQISGKTIWLLCVCVCVFVCVCVCVCVCMYENRLSGRKALCVCMLISLYGS